MNRISPIIHFRTKYVVDISREVVVLLVVVHPELGTGLAGPSAGLTLPVTLQEITQAFLGSILK